MLKYLVVSAIKIVFLPIILLTLFPITGFAYVNFSDVNDDSHYKDAIDWMSENGFINGHPDGTFRPDDCVNRVELLKMIFETLEINIFDYNADLFSDTEANVWYTPYVIAGRARGTIVGYPDGTFKPDQCANRVEAIKMAILEFNNGEIPEQWDEFENPFDIAQVKDNPWWMPYFKSAMGANLIGIEHFERFDADWMGLGVDSDSANPTYNFGPSESMTRKEVAEMLYRMRTIQDNDMQYFDENIEPDNVDTMPEEEEANNSGEPPSENEEEPATEEEPPSENEEEPATEEEPPSENEEEPATEEEP
ncbi:S-layer homology domain-containing protein, partial [Patescibacteria group bacterium]|nr:S-layer homology domain-containing protein [Patescibacteria group bacterium]